VGLFDKKSSVLARPPAADHVLLVLELCNIV